MRETVNQIDHPAGSQSAASRFRMALDFLESEAVRNGWDGTARNLCAARDALADDLGIGSLGAHPERKSLATEANNG